MVGINWLNIRKLLVSLLLAAILSWGVEGCSDRPRTVDLSPDSDTPTRLAGRIAEVSPPEALQELRQDLEVYQPQVKILSPRPDQVLQDDRISVRLQVQDLPIFQNQEFGLGPHLHVILDNQPYEAVYDTSEPLVLSDLSPGTHTLRVFASRPWHESFKNEGAYAQTTFHLFTKTPENNPDSAQPLLTYSRPKGSYGAEPIMLDFYLTNAPLHLIAQENSEDEILDWRIRCTINGESFIFDRWQPIYLKGLKPGKNWVQLELLDEKGEPFSNPFNNTVRLITYEPKGQDALSKLVRGELSAEAVRRIVDPNYTPEPVAPEPALPTPIPEPSLEPTPEPAALPTEEFPKLEELPEVEQLPDVEELPKLEELPEVEQLPDMEQLPEVEQLPKVEEPQLPAPEPVESQPSALEPDELEKSTEQILEDFQDRVLEPDVAEPEDTPAAPEPVETPRSQPTQPTSPKNFFDRFRRRTPEPAPIPVVPPPVVPPSLPEVLEPPSINSTVNPEADQLPSTGDAAEELEPIAPLEPTPAETSGAIAPSDQAEESPKSRGFFDRFRRPVISPTPLKPEDTLPEIIETPQSELTEPEMPESEPESEPLGISPLEDPASSELENLLSK